MSDKNVMLHCHIFKNAGSTLDWALKRSFNQGFFDHREDQKMLKEGIKYLDEFLYARPEIFALSSHHMPFEPEHSKHYWWLVLLREPLRRVRSVYDFEVKQRPIASLGSKMAKKLNLSEYINWRIQSDVPTVIKNFHVRYLSNATNPSIKVDEVYLEKALQRLSLNNVLVGTVEHFDESMVLFEDSLRKVFPGVDLSYVRQNVGRHKLGDPLDFLDHINPDVRELLIVNNQLDMKLYDMVSAEQSALTKNFPDFEKRLDDFKKRCLSLAVKRYA